MFGIFYKMMANYYAMKHLLSKCDVTVTSYEDDSIIVDESTEYISDLNVF